MHIGTSGWTYDHWQGPFYPKDLPQDEWLSFYAEHFRSVEINNSFCIYEFAGRQSPKEVTADFAYVRLHGPLDEPYRGSYDTPALSGWAGALSAWRRQGHDVFCYFDNDEAGQATLNAQALQEMLD